MNRYRLFGLTIDSEISLPELLPAGTATTADVTIRRGPITGEPDIAIEGVADYAVRDGREIVVMAGEGVPPQDVRLFLLGSAMGLLLHQRGLLPLHANAVEVDGRAIAVAGPSGAGKSTLAAWFHDRGHRLVGDDVCALDLSGTRPIVFPGVPRLRLWGSAIDATGRSRDGLERSYLLADDADKWDVPVDEADVVHDGLPLRSIYVLEDGEDIGIAPLTGAQAAEALFAHTYRGFYVEEIGAAEAHWRSVVALLSGIEVFRLTRPLDFTRRDALGECLLTHASRP